MQLGFWGSVERTTITQNRKVKVKKNAADDLGHAVSGLIDKAVKKFPEQMMVCPEAKGGHFEHSQ